MKILFLLKLQGTANLEFTLTMEKGIWVDTLHHLLSSPNLQLLLMLLPKVKI